MEKYYVESIIQNIAKEIKRLIDQKIITEDKKIVLYGLDTFSFAMRTIFENYGYKVDSYISDSQEQLIRYKRHIKGIRARYLNSSRDLIRICSIEERLLPFEEKLLIISSSKDCPIDTIEKLNYQKNINLFQVYNWEIDEFKGMMYGKQRIEMKEIQNLTKDMLFQVDRFCVEKGLRYWVCGGTLLGTIRHKGFIPWDDDIDVFMPLEDYQIFLKKFTYTGKYSLIEAGGNDRRKYYEMFSKMVDNRTMLREDLNFIHKIHPVSIDIFPLVGLPGDTEERYLFFEKYNEVEKNIWEDFYANNGDLNAFNKWYSIQQAFLEKFDFERSDYVGVLATVYKEKDCTTRAVYDHTLRMPFEDIEVNVPGGYQEYLDNLYGKDWMQLPEESKRVSHHNMEAYWL